jgi:pimeloyl-ACP methyl ester carboxylesterase
MLKPPVPTSLASDAPPRPPGLRPPRRPWRMPLRRAGPARPGPVPRRWIFPRRPGRPRAGHPGSDPFGHRDRPDGLGTPLERVHQAAALLSGRTLAMVLAPSPPGGCHGSRTVAVLRHRAEPTLAVVRQGCRSAAAGLCPGAGVSGHRQAAMFDVPTRLERIACSVLLMQGTNDPLVSMQSPRFLAFVRHAQMQWLPWRGSGRREPGRRLAENERLAALRVLDLLSSACRDAAWVGQGSRSTPAIRPYRRRQGATTTTIPAPCCWPAK